MTRIFAIATVFASLSSAALAQTNCQTYGSQTFCNGPGGSSQSQTYGGQTYINRQDTSGQQRQTVCQRYGNQTYCN